jgi:hypothetical protein
MKKFTMELVWHNCKTCPPSEEYNDGLLLWDGNDLFCAEWDNGYWWYDNHYLDMTGEEDVCWWSDIRQTVQSEQRFIT